MDTIDRTDSKLFNVLMERCPFFPSSTDESTMLYDYNKLLNILQKKELLQLVKDEAAIDHALMLATLFGEVSRKIVLSNGADEETMIAFSDLQRRIENELSGDLYMYATQWGLSVKALYYYKRGDFKKASTFSLECIVLNEYLVREGVFSLLFRAAEQIKNISRVQFRAGDRETGAALAKDLLNYLLNGEPGSLYGKIFSDREIWGEIPYGREGYAYHCFRSVVSLMVHLEKKQVDISSDLFSAIFGDLVFDVDNPDRQIMYDWICLKRAFTDDDWDGFLHRFIGFMEEPKCKLYDICKIASFLDLIKLVNRSSYRHKKQLLQMIDTYLGSNFNLAEYLDKDASAKNLVYLDSVAK